MFPNLKIPTLAKQLLGAAGGTLFALIAYGTYTMAAPSVQAFVASVMTPSTEAASKFTDADREERRDEIVARAKEIIEENLGR